MKAFAKVFLEHNTRASAMPDHPDQNTLLQTCGYGIALIYFQVAAMDRKWATNSKTGEKGDR